MRSPGEKRNLFVITSKWVLVERTAETHADWFKKLKLSSTAMDDLVRGYVDATGVYAYRTERFSAGPHDIRALRFAMSELQKRFRLPDSHPVYAGRDPYAEGNLTYEGERYLEDAGRYVRPVGFVGEIVKAPELPL